MTNEAETADRAGSCCATACPACRAWARRRAVRAAAARRRGGARRGAGETKLELDRRHVHARIDALAEKLAEMEKRRGESRKARAKTGMPVVSLVG
ncbi:MAG: hypothetical protein ACLT9S_11305 [Faecalibacterium sp.]